MKDLTIDKLRHFYRQQGFVTRTYINSDDLKKWWVLEVSYNGEKKGAFIFDYITEKLLMI